MGGIINVFTLSPMEYQGTNLKISTGNYGLYNVSASHYAKLNDKVAFSSGATEFLSTGMAISPMNIPGTRWTK